MVAPAGLELQFHKEMVSIYQTARDECGYNATRFLNMVANDGGLHTAHVLLATDEPSDGFEKLWECGRLDLTVENLVLNPMYRELFSESELEVAKQRLSALGFVVQN